MIWWTRGLPCFSSRIAAKYSDCKFTCWKNLELGIGTILQYRRFQNHWREKALEMGQNFKKTQLCSDDQRCVEIIVNGELKRLSSFIRLINFINLL